MNHSINIVQKRTANAARLMLVRSWENFPLRGLPEPSFCFILEESAD